MQTEANVHPSGVSGEQGSAPKVSPTAIDVDMSGDTRASVSWKLDGARFHVWIDINTKEIDRDRSNGTRTLYKNSIAKYPEPGYFDTRKLDADNNANAPIIRHVFKIVEQRGLIAKAIAKEAERIRQRDAQAAEEVRIHRIKEAGPQLLTALEAVLARLLEAQNDEPLDFDDTSCLVDLCQSAISRAHERG